MAINHDMNAGVFKGISNYDLGALEDLVEDWVRPELPVYATLKERIEALREVIKEITNDDIRNE